MMLHLRHQVLVLTFPILSVACSERVPITPTGPSQNTNPAPTTQTCTYLVSLTSRSHTSGADENGAVSVLAPSGCAWTASSGASWITVTSGSSGTGNGTVFWAVEANSGPSRTGTLTVAGYSVTVNQGTPSPTPYDGRWAGSGRGVSSGSTPALMETTFVINDGVIAIFNLQGRIDTAPGTPQSSFCNPLGSWVFIRIITGAFLFTAGIPPSTFGYRISGTFNSPNSVSGTAEIVLLEGSAQPWCLGATINWSATKQ